MQSIHLKHLVKIIDGNEVDYIQNVDTWTTVYIGARQLRDMPPMPHDFVLTWSAQRFPGSRRWRTSISGMWVDFHRWLCKFYLCSAGLRAVTPDFHSHVMAYPYVYVKLTEATHA